MKRRRSTSRPSARAIADDEAHARIAADYDQRLVARLRTMCMAYPEVIEVEQFGRPWWKAGQKSFCVYGAESEKSGDTWRGCDGAAFNVSPMDQAGLTSDPRFSRTPHLWKSGWTTMSFRAPIDWPMVERLLETAYRRVALKRMLASLDERR